MPISSIQRNVQFSAQRFLVFRNYYYIYIFLLINKISMFWSPYPRDNDEILRLASTTNAHRLDRWPVFYYFFTPFHSLFGPLRRGERETHWCVVAYEVFSSSSTCLSTCVTSLKTLPHLLDVIRIVFKKVHHHPLCCAPPDQVETGYQISFFFLEQI